MDKIERERQNQIHNQEEVQQFDEEQLPSPVNEIQIDGSEEQHEVHNFVISNNS